jgi:hypothetical protein
MELTYDENTAASMGIINVRNTTTHIDWWKNLPYAGWSRELLNNPDNLLLNRLEGPIVISSLIEFADEFSLNLFCLKNIYQDMEGGMESLRHSFLN